MNWSAWCFIAYTLLACNSYLRMQGHEVVVKRIIINALHEFNCCIPFQSCICACHTCTLILIFFANHDQQLSMIESFICKRLDANGTVCNVAMASKLKYLNVHKICNKVHMVVASVPLVLHHICMFSCLQLVQYTYSKPL